MDRLEITAAIGIIALIGFTTLAHITSRATDGLTQRIETVAAAKAPVRTRVITSVLDEAPTIVGSTGKRTRTEPAR